MNAHPRGWTPHLIETRFVSATPTSYDASSHTVEAVISNGSPVKRFYGVEILRIDSASVNLYRMKSSGIPVLDSHQQSGIDNAVGRLSRVWIAGKSLIGKISFNETEKGKLAEGMVSRGEISGISAGYRVEEWEIRDEDGAVIDPERDRVKWDDDLTFTATRWELLECSLVCVPADPTSVIRSLPRQPDDDYPDALRAAYFSEPQRIADTRSRMLARERMYQRYAVSRRGMN